MARESQPVRRGPQEAEENAAVRYARLPVAEAAAAAGVDPGRGLTEAAAAVRLHEAGPNSIPVQEATPFALLRRQLRSGLTILLLGAAGISLIIGNLRDAAIIAALVLLNTVVGLSQEYRAARAVGELRRIVQVQARVRRDGAERITAAEQVVPGDVVLVEAGDIVPADLRLIEIDGLTSNEASLTGESMPVAKDVAAVPSAAVRPNELRSILFAGTTVLTGQGTGIVSATGGRTYFGQTASLLRGLERPGPFERRLNRLANVLLTVGVIALAAVVAVNALLGRGVLESLVFGLALIVGIVPEALPAVTATTLALGASELARRKVLVKRLSALQDLSSITVVCADKTGTLTTGVMRVEAVWGAPDLLPEAVLGTTYPERGVDPIYDAIADHALQEGVLREGRQLAARVRHLPFDPQRKRASTIISRDGGYEVIVLGAPLAVLAVSADFQAVGSRQDAEAQLQSMTARALRVVAVGRRSLRSAAGEPAEVESDLEFRGLIGMGDPVRPGVPEAISHARRLNVQVKMLTGDNALTACAVGRILGLGCDRAAIVAGEELRRQQPTASQLRATIFAQLVPQDKYQIVQGLEDAGEAVAVTGDGVNDAPALRAATVGVAVASGTAVAKEAGDLILIDDDFAALVAGIGKGREILANLSKYLLYTLPGNLTLLITILLASVILPFLPLQAPQVLVLAIVADLPLLAIVTDVVDPEDLVRPEQLDVRRIITLAGALGVLGAAFSLGLILALQGAPQPVVQTALLYELALSTLFLAPVVHSRHPLWREPPFGRPLLAALATALAFFVVLVSVSNALATALRLVVLPATLNVALVAYSAFYGLAAEGVSAGYYRYVGR